jgi:hypothetical protein
MRPLARGAGGPDDHNSIVRLTATKGRKDEGRQTDGFEGRAETLEGRMCGTVAIISHLPLLQMHIYTDYAEIA